jgi:hypothetical protein
MADVVPLRVGLVGDGAKVDCDNVLTAAQGQLRTVLVIGERPDGELYVAGSDGVADSVLLMERAKHWFIENTVLRS